MTSNQFGGKPNQIVLCVLIGHTCFIRTDHNFVLIHEMNIFEESEDYGLGCLFDDGNDYLSCLTQYPDNDIMWDQLSQAQELTKDETDLFVQEYNNSANQDTDLVIDGAQFTIVTKNLSSPLFEQLVQKETRLDDLVVGSSKDSTYVTTYVAVRSFNFWWNMHKFNRETEANLFDVRSKFAYAVDGFEGICHAMHAERNILLAHYVSKMLRRKEKQNEGDLDDIMGSTKRGYLNSLCRAMHLYEKHCNLMDFYGRDWSWADSIEYQQTRAALDNTTMKNEVALSPSKVSKASEFMEETQFLAMLAFSWSMCANVTIGFKKQLENMVYYFCLGLITFGCLRGRDEISECLVGEFVIVDEVTIDFQMKRPFKSGRLTSMKKVVHKPARYIVGENYVLILKLLNSHRYPELNEKTSRLFLRPLPSCTQTSQIWFGKAPIGKNEIGEITKKYVTAMVESSHPLFDGNDKFTNTSLRKYHEVKLSEAGAPLIVQQQSLAQNTKAYANKPQNHDTKAKVAGIVAGKIKSWHEPAIETSKVYPETNSSSNSWQANSNVKVEMKAPPKKRFLASFEHDNKENMSSATKNIGIESEESSASGRKKQIRFTITGVDSTASFCIDM